MFGISPLGWAHTLGSLPAIPVAVYMLVRHGRIVPRSKAGLAYFSFMLIGAVTVFFVAHQPVSYGIAAATLVFLFAGYGARGIPQLRRTAQYIETAFLTVTVFLLMAPTVTETLRRVPDGHPFVTDLTSPLLRAVQAGLLAMLIIGLSAQLMYLRRKSHAVGQAG